MTTVPVPGSMMAVRPGECPPERYYKLKESGYQDCVNDEDCDEGLKCCTDNGSKLCKPPDKEKDGKCPESAPITERCTDMCSSDSECPSTSKCCFTQCGKECVPDFGEKDGACEMKDVATCIWAQRSLCTKDGGCWSNRKCCPNGCARRCLNPVSG
ncbi:hypothetical protein GDO81_029614 [Engystomops pustulosus]|uniref:WAP domain-containing protein n=1 Tax=Engystomops pustulosus TaxID=76066 RepID=A0AAV6ZCF4_ENGPU|nr:hypothetical protein GDO81_029614 [Engystomops pustulosus]